MLVLTPNQQCQSTEGMIYFQSWRRFFSMKAVQVTMTRRYDSELVPNSTDSERPHCCCHLANNFGPRREFPILHTGPRNTSQNCQFPRRVSKLPPNAWGFLVHPSPHTERHNAISTGSAVWAQLTVVTSGHTDTQTHRSRYVYNSRPCLCTAWSMRRFLCRLWRPNGFSFHLL